MDPSPSIPATARARLSTILGVVIVAVAAIIATNTLRTPTPGDEIDLDAAERHVAVIASEPHPMGSAAIADVRAHLFGELAALGLDPVTQAAEAPDWFGAPGRTVEIVNVMARIPGTGSGDALVFMAHYDTVPETPGANDNAAAVAGLLEVTRAVLSDAPMRNDVIILFTDGEEPQPRFGASAFTDHPWFDDVVLAVNLEGIGQSGPSLLVELSGSRGWMINEFRTAAGSPVAFSFLTEAMRLLGGSATDFDVFRDAGVPGLNFAFARGSSIYHTAADDLEALHVGGMAHNAELALGVARHFGELDLASAEADEAVVFFTLPGHLLVSYPATWSWVVYLAGVALTAAAVRRHRRRTGASSSVGRGVAAVAGMTLTIGVVATVAWTAIAALRPSMRTVESYVWAGVLLVAIVGSWPATRRLTRRWDGGLVSGTLIVWAVLGGASAVFAPAIGYVFVWGTLVGGIAGFLLAGPDRRVELRMGVLAGVAVPMLILAVPIADSFFLFAGPRPGNPGSEVPAAIAVSAFVAYLVVALIGIVLTERPDRAPVPAPERTPQATSTTASWGSDRTPT